MSQFTAFSIGRPGTIGTGPYASLTEIDAVDDGQRDDKRRQARAAAATTRRRPEQRTTPGRRAGRSRRPGRASQPAPAMAIAETQTRRPAVGSCPHEPPCPGAYAIDRAAARVVAAHPEQGWSLLCNGVIAFDDAGELLPDGTPVDPRRGPAPHLTRTPNGEAAGLYNSKIRRELEPSDG